MAQKQVKAIVVSYRDTKEHYLQLLSFASASGLKISELIRQAATDYITKSTKKGTKP